MSNWTDSFPSTFLKADDISAPFAATIASIALETVGTDTKEQKLVVTFREPHVKRITLNKTRCEALQELADSPKTEEWIGLQVQISRGRTRYGGKLVNCIVLGPVRSTRTTAPAPPAGDMDDDISFAMPDSSEPPN